MAPGGIEPPRAGSKPAALSTELRGRTCSRLVALSSRAEVSTFNDPLRSGWDRVAESQRAPATLFRRVADGTRTRDHRDHNPGLYQLSYRHHGGDILAVSSPTRPLTRVPGVPLLERCRRGQSVRTAPESSVPAACEAAPEAGSAGREAPPARDASAPGRIRTSDQRLRRPSLCPLSYGRPARRVATRSEVLAYARRGARVASAGLAGARPLEPKCRRGPRGKRVAGIEPA